MERGVLTSGAFCVRSPNDELTRDVEWLLVADNQRKTVDLVIRQSVIEEWVVDGETAREIAYLYSEAERLTAMLRTTS